MEEQQIIPVEKIQLSAAVENALIRGDLSGLTEQQRIELYTATCKSLGLNPLTKPFEYLELDAGGGKKKLQLYTTRNCTDQLRRIHNVSVVVKSRELIDGVFIVTATAKMPDGREDESIGAVPLVRERGTWKTAEQGKR